MDAAHAPGRIVAARPGSSPGGAPATGTPAGLPVGSARSLHVSAAPIDANVYDEWTSEIERELAESLARAPRGPGQGADDVEGSLEPPASLHRDQDPTEEIARAPAAGRTSTAWAWLGFASIAAVIAFLGLGGLSVAIGTAIGAWMLL